MYQSILQLELLILSVDILFVFFLYLSFAKITLESLLVFLMFLIYTLKAQI